VPVGSARPMRSDRWPCGASWRQRAPPHGPPRAAHAGDPYAMLAEVGQFYPSLHGSSSVQGGCASPLTPVSR